MTLREYAAQVPWQDGRLPLLPAHQHPFTRRWLIPGGPDGFWYCDATRDDIFWLPDTVDARCLPLHLAPHDPDAAPPVTVSRTLPPWLRKAREQRAAARQARALNVAATRLAQWLSVGQFTLADDDLDKPTDPA